MVKLNLDLRFAIIATETHVAKRLADLGLRRIEGTDQDVRRLVLDELEASGYQDDEVERDIAHQEIYFLEDEIPRLETYGILFVLFSTYESVVKRLPGYIGGWSPATVTSKKGNSFLSKVARFYGEELQVSLFTDDRQETAVRRVADVRNAVAHATGQMSMLNSRLRKRITGSIERDPAISVVNGELQFSPAYVRSAAAVLDEAASQLIKRLKVAY